MNWRKWLGDNIRGPFLPGWRVVFGVETEQERSLRVREQCAKAARDRLRFHIAAIKAQRLKEVRYELEELGRKAVADFDNQPFALDPDEQPLKDIA